MARPRKEIAQQIQQQAEALNCQSADVAVATIQEIASEADEIAAEPDVSVLLDQLADLARKVHAYCEMGHGPGIRAQLLSLIDQIKAEL